MQVHTNPPRGEGNCATSPHDPQTATKGRAPHWYPALNPNVSP